MSVRKIFRRSDLERVAARFSTDTVEDIIRCSDKVLANGTNLAMQQIFLPAADENPFAEFKVIDDACDKLESFWKPRIQQYICSRVLDADPKTFDKIGNGDESWAISVARETRDMLMSEASLGHHPPYGLPRPLASAPVDQGGYDGWDRNLLLSPYQMQGVTGTIVDFVPHDAPGMTDALACLAIYEAIDNLTVPSEAYQLSVAKSFTPSCDLDGLSWDSARAARQLAKLHMRCEHTEAGNLALAISAGLQNPDLRERDWKYMLDKSLRLCASSATPTCQARFAAKAIKRNGQISEDELHAAEGAADNIGEEHWDMLRTAVEQACTHVYGPGGTTIRQTSDELMQFFRVVVQMGALAAMAGDKGRKARWYRYGVDTFLRQQRDSIEHLFIDCTLDSAAFVRGRLKRLELGQSDLFRRFTIDRQWRSRLDPVLAIGFVALDAGVAMPEATYLLDLTEGWSRFVWDATVLSCRAYGGVIPGNLDIHAGVDEIREHYNKVVPTLAPPWREAFERQWKIFTDDMRAATRLYGEALRR